MAMRSPHPCEVEDLSSLGVGLRKLIEAANAHYPCNAKPVNRIGSPVMPYTPFPIAVIHAPPSTADTQLAPEAPSIGADPEDPGVGADSSTQPAGE